MHELAPMLGLRVVDALEHAIVLAPQGPESVFAATLTDLRKDLGDMPRGALALIHVAIAADVLSDCVGTDGYAGGPCGGVGDAGAYRVAAARALPASGRRIEQRSRP